MNSNNSTALAPVSDFTPVRLMPLKDEVRADLIAEAARGNITSNVLSLPLTPAPSATWRSGFVTIWRNEYGGNEPGFSEREGIQFPIGVAFLPTGLQGYINQLKRIIDMTNEKYADVWRTEQAERAQADAERREREQQMANLLDSIRVND